jgi:hypothetical protein
MYSCYVAHHTHWDKPVALVIQIEDCKEASCSKVVSMALAQAPTVRSDHDKVGLAVDKSGIREEGRATAILGQQPGLVMSTIPSF